jgi:hypothetical protein
MSMHPRRAGRNRREILRNSGDSGKPAAQAKRGRPERGADRSEGPTEGPGRVVWALFGLLADPNSQGASNPQPTKHKRA